MKLRLMICAAAASTALFAGDNDATSATYAVMNVTNAYTDTVIAVPWVGLDGNTITISNLVNSTTIASGDKLYMYGADGKWYAYTKNAAGNLEGNTTISSEGVTITDAAVQTVARGTGLILQRASVGGNILLCGRVDSDSTSVSTTLAANGKTLFANPTASEVDMNSMNFGAAAGDLIIVPQSNGGSVQYSYKDSKWGRVVEKEFEDDWGPYIEQVWTEGCVIPVGTGAWYVNGGSAKTISW